MIIFKDRFSTLKLYFEGCLRLAKLFKLNDLLEEFHKKLYTLDIKSDEKSAQNSHNKQTCKKTLTSNDTDKQNPSLQALNEINDEVNLNSFDTNVDNPTLPIDEADIFCKCFLSKK
jgi:hypothetical protein